MDRTVCRQQRLLTVVRKHPRCVLGLLVLVFAFQVGYGAIMKSVTVDEFAHLPAGLVYLKTGDFSVYHHNPPLIKQIAALPLLIGHVSLPEDFGNRWELGGRFAGLNAPSYHLLFLRGRAMILLLALVLGIALYGFTRESSGRDAALLAVFLFVLCPHIIAHSRFVTTDIGATLGILLVLWTFWRLHRRYTLSSVLWCGIAFGFAQLTKFSALSLVPALPLLSMVLIRSRVGDIDAKKALTGLLAVYLIGVGVINVGYGFQGAFQPAGSYGFKSGFFQTLQQVLPGWFPVPFPREYTAGLDEQKYESDRPPVPAYLMGRISEKGWRYYYPLAVLIKTRLPVLILFIAAIFGYLRRKSGPETDALSRYLFAFVVLYLAMFSTTVVNLGIRYLLPVYPLIFMLCARYAAGSDAKGKLLTGLLCVWMGVNAVTIFPHHLSFFNELAGGPANGHRFLADSNLDWGQDLKLLRRYMDKRGLSCIYLSHFGLVEPALYGIRHRSIPPRPTSGTVAVSVNHLLGIAPWKPVGRRLDWLKAHCPVDRVGYSILIYDIPGVGAEIVGRCP